MARNGAAGRRHTKSAGRRTAEGARWGTPDLGGTIGTLRTKGADLRVARWPGRPGGPGTVILVHGFGEYMEVYGETVSDLLDRGFGVVSFDFRGHGGSARKVRGAVHVDAFTQYEADLLAVVRHARDLRLPRPFIVAAHSMGGLVALRAAPALASEVSRLVLFAPLLRVARLPVPDVLARMATGLLCALGLSRVRVARSIQGDRTLEGNRLSRDDARFSRLIAVSDANPQLSGGPPTFGWVRSVLGAAAAMRRRRKTPLPLPTLILAAGADAVVSTRATDRFAREAPGAGLLILPASRHLLLLEVDEVRRPALAAFDAFIAARDAIRTVPAEAPQASPMPFHVGAASDLRPALRDGALKLIRAHDPGDALLRARRQPRRGRNGAEPAIEPSEGDPLPSAPRPPEESRPTGASPGS